MSIILGICDGVTSGAAIIANGKILAAVNEERLIRKKMAIGFPQASISEVLRLTNLSPQDIDKVAIATKDAYFRPEAGPFEGWFHNSLNFSKKVSLTIASSFSKITSGNTLSRKIYYETRSIMLQARQVGLRKLLREKWRINCPIEFIDHHFCHACSAYFTSGLEEALVLTLDGAGDCSSSHIYLVKDMNFKLLCSIDSFDSIGNYYAYVTHLCGFKAHIHEGKVTGLAAFGDPKFLELLNGFITFHAGRIINIGKVFYWSAIKKMERLLPRQYDIKDLAASIQILIERVVVDYIKFWLNKTGLKDLAVAGGVFANVKLNQRIHEIENLNTIFIHPGMGDEGLAIGAAYAQHYLDNRHSKQLLYRSLSKLNNLYLGPEFTDGEIRRELEKEGVNFRYIPEIEKKIAVLLAKGKVVARFDGRMEYGPRALGNRSVLYQATDPSVNDWLNKKLARTEFMPFAPVTLSKYAGQNYKNMGGAEYASKFMTITFDCTNQMKEMCPAVVHVDNTARPQIIDEETNQRYYHIIEEYRKITGLPTIINTSFNMHEEPIVCTPRDAIKAFKVGHLDYLAIGNYLATTTDDSNQVRDI